MNKTKKGLINPAQPDLFSNISQPKKTGNPIEKDRSSQRTKLKEENNSKVQFKAKRIPKGQSPARASKENSKSPTPKKPKEPKEPQSTPSKLLTESLNVPVKNTNVSENTDLVFTIPLEAYAAKELPRKKFFEGHKTVEDSPPKRVPLKLTFNHTIRTTASKSPMRSEATRTPQRTRRQENGKRTTEGEWQKWKAPERDSDSFTQVEKNKGKPIYSEAGAQKATYGKIFEQKQEKRFYEGLASIQEKIDKALGRIEPNSFHEMGELALSAFTLRV